MINVLFCGNDGVFDGMLTCALSILKRTETKEPFAFYVFTMDVSHLDPRYVPVRPEQMAFFEEVIRKYNPQNAARCVDVSQVEYAAARDHYGKYLVHPNYVNAGVLLFNLQRMRETGLLEKARGWIKTKKLMFADQSAIIRSTTKKRMLPQKFNDQKFLHRHTVVRHFSKRLFWLPYPHTENIKQWQVERVHKVFRYHQFDDILKEYLDLKEQFTKGVKTHD